MQDITRPRGARRNSATPPKPLKLSCFAMPSRLDDPMMPPSHATFALTAGLLSAAVLSSTAAPAAAASTDEIEQLRAQVQAMRAEIDKLKRSELDDARDHALSDAKNRVSFRDAPLVSGHNGKNFILTDPAGDFTLAIYGQIQARYGFNTSSGDGTDVDGFELRRTRIGIQGNLDQGKRFGYNIVLAYGTADGVADIEDAEIHYTHSSTLKAILGQKRLPFARQELISNVTQLGAERSPATEYFTLNRSQGLWLEYQASDQLDLTVAFSDGADNGFPGDGSDLSFDSAGDDDADLALTARADYAIKGKGKASTDVVAWRGEDDVLLVGAAGHLNFAQEVDDFYAVTADVLYKSEGLSGLAAVYGLFTDDDDDSFDFGVTLEGGYNIDDTWQPFARFDYADIDGAGDELVAFGGGVNYYIDKHSAKLTLDATYVTDRPTSGRTPNTPGGGIGLNGESDQLLLRAQFQLLF